MITPPTADARTILLRAQQQDLHDLTAQLRDSLLENKRLRQRLRVILNCTDLKCSMCATCLDAVRE